MSEQERGAYTPQTDAPLAFDARQPRGGGGGPAPLTLMVSAIILMALIVGVLLFYRHGVRHAGQAPEVVGAPVGQTKSAPTSGASSSDQAASLQVYKSEATPPSESRAPSFEPPPEQPAPLPAARPPTPPPAVITTEPLRGATTAAPAPKLAAPKPVAVAKAPPPPAPAAAPSAPIDAGNVAGSAFGPHPAAPPHAQSSAPHAAAAATSSAKPVAVETAASAAGGATVQIGAFSSAALAQKGWSDTAQLVPGPMAGKSRKVEATTKDGKTFYRAYVGGFASHQDAVSFCTALRAKNKPCFVK
jgi:hypothetical protein